MKSSPHHWDSPGLLLVPEITSKCFQHTLSCAPKLPLGLHVLPLLPQVLFWPLRSALLLILLSVSFPALAATNASFRGFLCSAPEEALLLSSFTLLLPLASGVIIQSGDSSSGMVAWEGVKRVWGG